MADNADDTTMENDVVEPDLDFLGLVLQPQLPSSSTYPPESAARQFQGVWNTHPPRRGRRRTIPTTTTPEEEMQKGKLLKELKKYPCIWKTQSGKRTSANKQDSEEWRAIAKEVTGNPDDSGKMRNWYIAIKKQIRYRIGEGIKLENLTCNMDKKKLENFCVHHPFGLWEHAEYLLKYLIFQNNELRVDIDGDLMPRGQSNLNYDALLNGVPGCDLFKECDSLPPIPRRNGPDSQEEEDNEGSLENTTGGSYAALSGFGSVSLGTVKQEPEDMEYENDCQQGFDDRNPQADMTMSQDSTLQQVKHEDSGSQRLCGNNPLKFLLRGTPGNLHPPPRGEDCGISDDELQKRIEAYQRFVRYFKDKVMIQEPSKQRKFIRLLIAVSGVLSDHSATNAQDCEVLEKVETTIQNFEF